MNEGTVTVGAAVPVTVISEDAECIKILKEVNMLDQAVRHPPFDTTSLIFEYKEYVALCVYSEGFEKPEDNGYWIAMIHRDSCDRAVAIQFLASLIDHQSVPGTVGLELVPATLIQCTYEQPTTE